MRDRRAEHETLDLLRVTHRELPGGEAAHRDTVDDGGPGDRFEQRCQVIGHLFGGIADTRGDAPRGHDDPQGVEVA